MGNLREGLMARSGAHLGPVPAPKTQCNRLEHESLSSGGALGSYGTDLQRHRRGDEPSHPPEVKAAPGLKLQFGLDHHSGQGKNPRCRSPDGIPFGGLAQMPVVSSTTRVSAWPSCWATNTSGHPPVDQSGGIGMPELMEGEGLSAPDLDLSSGPTDRRPTGHVFVGLGQDLIGIGKPRPGWFPKLSTGPGGRGWPAAR